MTRAATPAFQTLDALTQFTRLGITISLGVARASASSRHTPQKQRTPEERTRTIPTKQLHVCGTDGMLRNAMPPLHTYVQCTARRSIQEERARYAAAMCVSAQLQSAHCRGNGLVCTNATTKVTAANPTSLLAARKHKADRTAR